MTLENELRERARKKAAKEMLDIRSAQWAGQNSEQRRATNLVSTANRMINSLIDDAMEPIPGNNRIQHANQTFIKAQLDLIESALEGESQTEMRLAKMQGIKRSMDAQRANLKEIATSRSAPEVINDTLDTFSSHAESVSAFIADLTQDPLKYVNIADHFINGTLVNKLPNIIAKKIPSAPNANQFIDFLKSRDIGYEKFSKLNKFFEGAAKFLSIVQIGLVITTAVLKTLADQGNWAPTLLKASVVGGSALALSAVVTSAAVTTAITSTFALAGSTVEVPPVAAVLLAAGIIMVAGVIIVNLYDSLVSLIFGSTSIHRSMRLSMSTQMFTKMSSSMSTPMAKAMLSNH